MVRARSSRTGNVPRPRCKPDTVIYSEYGGTEIQIEGEDFIILDESSVLAVKSGNKGKKK